MLDVQEAAVEAAIEVEERKAAMGWDAMAMLHLLVLGDGGLVEHGVVGLAGAPTPVFAVRDLARAMARFSEEGDAGLEQRGLEVHSVSPGGFGGGSGAGLLEALRAADGLAMSVEGWTYPEEVQRAMARGGAVPDVPPSEYPDRVEMRYVFVLMRNGVRAWAQRVRGGELESGRPGPGVRATGRAVEALEMLLEATGGAQAGSLSQG